MLQFSCEKALLQNAISVCSRAVASKSPNAALEGLLLQTRDHLIISGYNMQIGIRTHVEAEISNYGEIVLNNRLFSDIIRNMPDDVVTFTEKENATVHLHCGNADFDIAGLSASDYPDLPEVEEDNRFTIPQNTLREMIDGTTFAVSTNDIRPVQTGALFETDEEKLTVVAVDGFRMAIRRAPLEKIQGGRFSFVTPGNALNEVKSICTETDDPATVTLGKRHILYEIKNTELICRRLEGDFLDYKHAIPQNIPVHLTANTKELLDSVNRVSVVITEKLKSPLHCLFKRDTVTLNTKTSIGIATDTCSITGDGNNLRIGFNNRYLIDALRHIPSENTRIELINSVSPIIFLPPEDDEYPEKFLYMVLPLRLNS